MENLANKLIPVCSNSTGWPIIGYAKTQEQATRVIKKCIGDDSHSLIKNHKFILSVWRRTPFAIELNGGPECFTYSLGK